ncbi:MAG: hypothetical protein ACO4AV_13385 [bacterium]
MKFDGTPIRYDAPFSSPLNLDPPEHFEPEPEVEDFLISSGHGIFIPQIFTTISEQRNASNWAWQACKKGPPEQDASDKEKEAYDEAWAEILDTWEYEHYDANGCIYRYFLDQDEDLRLMRIFLRQELD